MADRFDIEQVIRILGLEIRADQADDGRDFDVACRIALEKLVKCKEYEDLEGGCLARWEIRYIAFMKDIQNVLKTSKSLMNILVKVASV